MKFSRLSILAASILCALTMASCGKSIMSAEDFELSEGKWNFKINQISVMERMKGDKLYSMPVKENHSIVYSIQGTEDEDIAICESGKYKGTIDCNSIDVEEDLRYVQDAMAANAVAPFVWNDKVATQEFTYSQEFCEAHNLSISSIKMNLFPVDMTGGLRNLVIKKYGKNRYTSSYDYILENNKISMSFEFKKIK